MDTGNMARSQQQKKRKREDEAGHNVSSPHCRPSKHAKGGHSQHGDVVRHVLLTQYYPKLQTLREYVLSRLPSSSRLRRKKIASLGTSDKPSGQEPDETELSLSLFLDSTLVALGPDEPTPEDDGLKEQFMNLSQKGDDSHVTLLDAETKAIYSQSELVDYVVWCLFKTDQTQQRPKHVLCDGYQRNRNAAPKNQGAAGVDSNSIPELYRIYNNNRVQTLKQTPWPLLLTLLGKCGERIMVQLLRHCSVFVSIEGGKGNYYQLSGKPLSDLTTLDNEDGRVVTQRKDVSNSEKSPAEVVFVRSRMLYARAALNARGLVHFGLRHIHVLNRFPALSKSKSPDTAGQGNCNGDQAFKNKQNTVRVMMYMFPRQFGLHNAFTSKVDHSQTAQKFQDYTLREEEIFKKFTNPKDDPRIVNARVPKRLRGSPSHLVERLQTLHSRCSYAALLQHYCPVQNQVDEVREHRPSKALSQAGRSHKKHQKTRRKSNQPSAAIVPNSYSSLIELATPISGVSAFCQAVLSKVIPNDFWGSGEVQSQNKQMFLRKVDHFVRLRRFETMSLHEVMNGLKITDIEWLAPPSLQGRKCSQTDFRKRSEIFLEFLYYLFDSLLIPLIRSNFYVTESNVHRYRLFYFRHDVWRYIAEPAMTAIRTKMFEEVKLDDARRILDSRHLGFSQVRLLPKETSVRPITNLRRRTLTKGKTKKLGPSINTILGPVHNVLKLEKSLNADRLGSTMFSVGDIYKRVKSYKQRLGVKRGNFYIAKVDVQSAFDTIPQQAIIDLMTSIPTHKQYKIVKHVEVKPNDSGTLTGATTTRRWHFSAKAAQDRSTFIDMLQTSLAANRKNTVLIDSVVQQARQTKDLLALMTSHIQQNLVKIGKKYYRQKDGIPQGSILSSLLCNYFYADLERQHLQFLQSEDSVLLRLIDDFLLITTDREKVGKFVQVMHRGMPEYGVTVSPHKSLVNFDLEINGLPVPRIPAGSSTTFPYCGTRLDCRTLEITKDRAGTTARDPVVANALTVEFARLPGQNLRRKVLNAFRIQSHLMFFDTTHNSPRTTLRNIYDAFRETATKMWAYARCLPKDRQPGPRLLAATITELVDVSFLLLTGKSRKARYPGYECTVKKTQVAWLALHAFRRVLEKKQARYREFIAWLDAEIQKLEAKKDGRVDITL